MLLEACVVFLLLASRASAQTVAISPSPLTGTEGSNLTVDCSVVGGGRTDFELTVNDSRIVTLAKFVNASVTPTGTQFVYGPLERSDSDKVFECDDSGGNRASATLVVHYPPAYSLLPNQPTTVLEGSDFTYSFGFEANSTPINFTWSRDGQVISSGGRIATSVSTISITSTTRSDSGVYEVVSYNEAGRGAGNFTLDVQFPPLIINRAGQTTLVQGEDFTFNCTSEPANPAAVDYTFQKDGQTVDGSRATVQGPVLTITSVQAGDGGNYSCSANNSVGKDTVYRSLSIVVPLEVPQAITVSDLGPFSATVSWQSPMEDGGAVGPLMYTVTLTNTSDSTTFKFNPTTALTMNLANLRHSVTYRVQVVAGNEAGMGPAAEVMFRTNDTVPTVSGVEAKALTLDRVQVDVTVSDDGGQPVLEYIVSVNGTTVMFNRSTGNVTGLSLINGVTYSVNVVARNSIGDSETVTSSFSVPFPPNITMQPVVVTPDETTTRCCAGVRVVLEDPSDPTLVFTAQVSTEGSPFTARSVTREGDVVYVQGLQAGTPYNIRLTGRNQFGNVTKEVSTTSLIGSPSDPSMPVVSVEGSSVSIQLSTRYPGTNARGQFSFSLIFSAASTAKRQSLQPTEVRVDPTGLDSSVTTTHTLTDVEAGKYSVSVMAVNGYGMSQEMTATFVVEGSCPGSTDQTPADLLPAVVALSAVLVVVVLLLAVAILTIILLYTRNQKLSSILKAVKDPNCHYDDVEMEPHNLPKSHSKSTTEPQYEECGGGVISSHVAMEENPAYQSVDVAAAKP